MKHKQINFMIKKLHVDSFDKFTRIVVSDAFRLLMELENSTTLVLWNEGCFLLYKEIQNEK